MTFQILSLSGGGFLGLYTASVLSKLEEQTGKPIIDSFDLVAGTSVGGIIALGLSAGRSASEIKQAFLDDGHHVFSGARPPKNFISSTWKLLTGIPASRYNPGRLREIIERIVGVDSLMRDLRRPTVIPAVNLTKGGPKVFKTGHHRSLYLDWKLKLVDVALATSAAPTYFPLHQIGDELFADGGLFANSPDLIAVHEAERFLGIAQKDIKVLSIGTTTTAFAFSSRAGKALGSFGWLKRERLPKVMIGSQQALADDMMKHMLAERYVRIDRAQPAAQQEELALDCASEIAKRDLQSAAASSVAEISSNDMLLEMLRHKASPTNFLNATFVG
ncbi:CBASS cGAMP-activated phospholipase [Mesorhizobium sp. CA7]|uniref:CBASS cGAMP-activated phospholipase n=1 Tax=Mesorhizobium sp. CA7 TaxID=588501 RepID=UPI001CCF19A7|nr:CBASS cGAMP-activated phospholipase [Mesorhizobium sp. CA7]MBZ9813830.1 patatin-like phospholipase family protein [Mesorhizobium sp. CA7]